MEDVVPEVLANKVSIIVLDEVGDLFKHDHNSFSHNLQIFVETANITDLQSSPILDQRVLSREKELPEAVSYLI